MVTVLVCDLDSDDVPVPVPTGIKVSVPVEEAEEVAAVDVPVCPGEDWAGLGDTDPICDDTESELDETRVPEGPVGGMEVVPPTSVVCETVDDGAD